MKEIKITLSWKDLLTEVHNTTYFTGRSRFTGDNPEQVANMQSDEEEESLIRRYLYGGSVRVRTALSAVLKQPLPISEETDSIPAMEDSSTVNYQLQVAGNFDMNQMPAIASAIHQTLVSHAVGEWFLVSNPGEAAVYFDKANAALSDLRSAINKRTGPSRRNTPAV